MTTGKLSGQGAFTFSLREDLETLPGAAREHEVKLHGGFAVDPRPGRGQVYFGMPECGIVRVEPDLERQTVLPLPAELRPLNFHSTKIGEFDGAWRLFMAADGGEKVAVLSTEGKVEFVLPRPEFEQYRNPEAPYKPTDTVLVDRTLYVADGYGSNYVSAADVSSRSWTAVFGGPAKDAADDGRFSTAHGINLNPVHRRLDVADRPNSRIQSHALDGGFVSSHKLPAGAWPCGIGYGKVNGTWYAVVGCLHDPDKNRPAPIYVLDARTYEVVSTVRPKEELGVEAAQHLHNVVPYARGEELFLICQSWNPGHYFVLQRA